MNVELAENAPVEFGVGKQKHGLKKGHALRYAISFDNRYTNTLFSCVLY